MRRITQISFAIVVVAAVIILLTPQAAAYCLTGVRWTGQANVYYNATGKVTAGQCISSSQLDSAVTGGIGPWSAIRYAGTTSAKANRRDGQNTVGWANLGGGTLGITNYLSYSNQASTCCGSNCFRELFEADVRIATAYRWTSGGGQCPCAAGSAYYLNGVSTHEFGHVVGLCHTNTPSSLMYPSFGACENKNKGSDETAGENATCW